MYVIVHNYCAVRWSRDYFLLEGIEITAICLYPLKIPTGLFCSSFLELKLFVESKMTKFSLPSEEPEEVTTPRNRTR